ncbi:hypothetical protein ZWY2020_010499 [Hordeum vulgare]|nr:hypothetical protein ZWY2020_010499 [Hordeum vulgare]
MRVAGPANEPLQTLFGAVYVMADPLTEKPELGSAAVGRAQGLAHGARPQLPARKVREMPIVGGTGAFRFARGYAQARTYSMNIKTSDANVEYDVYVMH